MTRFFLLLVLTLTGCALDHGRLEQVDAGADGARPSDAAQREASTDAPLFDTSIFDGSTFDARPEDATTVVSSCVLELGAREGDGCFCHGPLVGFDPHGHLFRQAIGIEMYTTGPLSLSEVHRIDESPSAGGGLALLPHHLLSITERRENPVTVYSLPEHSRPVEIVRLGNARATQLTTAQTHAAWQEMDTLVFADFSDAARPEIVWRASLQAQSIAITDDMVVVLTQNESGGTVHTLDRGTGVPLAQLFLGERADSVQAVGGRVFLLGGNARLTELGLEPLSLGRTFGPMGHSFEDLVLRTDGVAVLSRRLTALSLDSFEEIPITITTPGFPPDSLGYDSLVVDDANLMFGSNQNAVVALSMICE